MNETLHATHDQSDGALPVPASRGATPSTTTDIIRATTDDGTLLSGAALGSYRLVSRLANGSSAEIWLAKLNGAEGFEKVVALKVMHMDLERRTELADQLTHEASIGAQLYHPSIVQLLDFAQWNGRCFISMEYLDGLTLRQTANRLAGLGRRFPLQLLIHVAAQLCRGLHYGHELADSHGALGFIHRDVSPDNVMLSRSGQVKLIDFGAACIRSIPGPRGARSAQLHYAAPERLRELDEDRRSDVYGLGVVLYELMCGERPYEGDDNSLRSRIIEGHPASPRELVPHLPEGLVRVVLRAMAREPDDRYGSAEALGHNLQAAHDEYLAGGPVTNHEDTDLRIILNQVFRPGSSLAEFPDAIPFPPGRQATDNSLLGPPSRALPIPPEDDFLFADLPADARWGDDDVTEPCNMVMGEEVRAQPTREAPAAPAAEAPPASNPAAPTKAVTLLSLPWLFERSQSESRATQALFSNRERGEAEVAGSVFDYSTRNRSDLSSGVRAGGETTSEPPPADKERPAQPDIFATRRGSADPAAASATKHLSWGGSESAPTTTGSLDLERARSPRQLEAARCFDRGLAFLNDKQYGLAQDEWERALELDPDNRTYQTNLKRLRART